MIPLSSQKRLLWSFFTGFSLHSFLFLFLFFSEAPKRTEKKQKKPIEIRLVDIKEKAITITEKEVASLKKDVRRISKKEVVKKIEKKKSKETSEGKKQVQKKEKKKNKKARKFSISMEAVVADGTVSVEATEKEQAFAFGSQDGDPNAPKKRIIYDATDPSAISSLPVLKSSPSPAEMQRLYPPLAKREGIEANIKLKILVDQNGLVVDVLLEEEEEAQFGFDEVALKLARQFKFQPAEKNGEAVAVWIPWTYKFRLED